MEEEMWHLLILVIVAAPIGKNLRALLGIEFYCLWGLKFASGWSYGYDNVTLNSLGASSISHNYANVLKGILDIHEGCKVTKNVLF
jgi:hypothetical protein